MDRIIKIIGSVIIDGVEPVNRDTAGWDRRSGFRGFEGWLVIRLTDDGTTYAVIDNGRRCISTSRGELTLTADCAVFTTANSIYTFRIVHEAKAG